MIEGLIVTVLGSEVQTIIRAKADGISERAEKLRKLEAVTSTHADDLDVSSSNRPTAKAKDMEAEAQELRFIADHLKPTEEYQLGHEDLRRIGVVKGYR